MSRRIRKKPGLFAPLTDNLVSRLNSTSARTRRKIVRYGSWTLAGLFVYSLMIGDFSLPRIAKLEMEKHNLMMANRLQSATLIDATRIRSLLTRDPDYIEYIARTRYHMVKPGETLYRYLNR